MKMRICLKKFNKKYLPRGKQGGQAMLISVIFFLFISLAIISGLVGPSVRQFKIATDLLKSRQSFFLSESVIEDSYFRLKTSKTLGTTNTITLGESSATASITDSGTNQKTISSVGDVNSRQRKNEVVLNVGTGVSFSYGIQAGSGGLILGENAGVTGSVYSNGNIEGDNNSFITGTAFAADTSPLIADQNNTSPIPPTSSIVFGNTNETQDVAESFQVSQSNTVSKISLYLKKVGNPSNLTVRITADNGGKPNNSSIATATISSSLVTSNYGWINANFSSNPTLSSGVTYWIVIDGSTGSGTKYYEWGANSSYATGQAKIGKQGGTWNATSPSNLDGYFSLYLGGVTSTIDNVDIGQNGLGNAYANEVKDSNVAGTIYCQVDDGSNNKDCDVSLSNPAPLDLPISDANIQEWKENADDGSPINQNYTPAGSSSTLGPKKINGDLILNSNHVLTLIGGVWVTGDIDISGGATIQLSPSFGQSSGVLVADGMVHMDNNGLFSGSGQSGSYVMLVSTLDCDGTSSTGIESGLPCGHHDGAIDLHNNTDARGAILYAKDGMINMHNGVQLTEVSAKKIKLDNGTVVTYQQGVANLNFYTGPSGGWSITSWKEVK